MKAVWFRSVTVANSGSCSPFPLGVRVGQLGRLCLGIQGDPISTKEQAGMNVGLKEERPFLLPAVRTALLLMLSRNTSQER